MTRPTINETICTEPTNSIATTDLCAANSSIANSPTADADRVSTRKPIVRKNFAITVILVILQILVLILASKVTRWTLVDGTNAKLYRIALVNGTQRDIQNAIYASIFGFFALIPFCSLWIWILFFRHVSKRISHLFALPWGELTLVLESMFFTWLPLTCCFPKMIYTYVSESFLWGFALSIVGIAFLVYGALYRCTPKKETLCWCINIWGWLIFISEMLYILVCGTCHMLGIW